MPYQKPKVLFVVLMSVAVTAAILLFLPAGSAQSESACQSRYQLAVDDGRLYLVDRCNGYVWIRRQKPAKQGDIVTPFARIRPMPFDEIIFSPNYYWVPCVERVGYIPPPSGSANDPLRLPGGGR